MTSPFRKRPRFWQALALGAKRGPIQTGASFAIAGIPAPLQVLPQTQTLISAMTAAPSAARTVAIDTFIAALLSSGVWATLDGLWVTAAADNQAARLNWRNPGANTLVATNAPTFVADRGYTPTAANSYLDTNYNPGTGSWKYLQDDAAFAFWCNTDDATASSNLGSAWAASNSKIITLNPRSDIDTGIFSINGDATTAVASTNGSGFFVVRRTASNAIALFRNAVSLGTDTTVSSALPSLNHFVGGINNNGGGVTNKATTRQIALYCAGGQLTTAQISAFYAAARAYMTSVGN